MSGLGCGSGLALLGLNFSKQSRSSGRRGTGVFRESAGMFRFHAWWAGPSSTWMAVLDGHYDPFPPGDSVIHLRGASTPDNWLVVVFPA